MKRPKMMTLCACLLAAAPALGFALAQGVSKTEIVLGTIQDLSGPMASFGKDQFDGASGEVCVRGPLVGAGYLHQPEQTREACEGGCARISPSLP